ncbi:Rieske (2Fe-2S) protein [Acidocella sp.]|uniref:Rieske (2Fe-2S) protein n=1 Tax=Acidocella sp. TaxID=50710 RepID=UPI00260FDAEA|nr:Rieske (2Fe-2S) protein [Acidocella sp.]
MSEVEAALSASVREGAVLAVTCADKNLALTRVDGVVQAFVNKCPHLGLKLTKGKIADGVITCPFHGSSFDIRTGADTAWVSGVMGIALPKMLCNVIAMGKAPRGLTKLAAREADGVVYVGMP